MHAKHRLHGELLEQSVVDHLASAATALLGGLEDGVDRALEAVAMCGQILRRRQQHGRVAVVTAGMHLARMAAGMVKGVELLHGQGIHIGTQADGTAAAAAVAAMDDAHHPGLAQTAMDRYAPLLQLRRDQVRGPYFLKTQLRVGVDIATQRGNVRALA